MLSAETSSATRTANGRFAPGHSGNPGGRPKGSKSVGTLLVEALHDGEDETILRQVIEAALGGDKSAARFWAARIDGAARRRQDLPRLDISRADALNPFVLHAKLVQAVIEGAIPAEAALGVIRLSATKRLLSPYSKQEIDDEDYEALGEEPGDEEDGEVEEDSDDAEDDGEDHRAEDDTEVGAKGSAPEPAPASDPPHSARPAPVLAPECAIHAPAAAAPPVKTDAAPAGSGEPVIHLFCEATRYE